MREAKEVRQVKVQLTIAFWQAGGTSVADQIVGKQAHNKPTFRRVVAVESEAKLLLKNLPSFPLGKIVNSTFSPLNFSFFLSVKAVTGSGQSELKQ